MASKGKLQNGESEEMIYQSLLKYLCKLEAENNTIQAKLLADKINTCNEKLMPLQKGICSLCLFLNFSGLERDNEYKNMMKRREEAFFNSKLLYRYQVSLIEKIYQTEIKLAENEFQTECQNIRTNLLVDIEEKVHKLKEDRENVDVRNGYEVEGASRSHPSTRRNRKRVEQDISRPKKRTNNGTSILTPLKEDQISKDLSEIRLKRES